MKLMKRFKNKNLAKAVCLGLLSTGGILGLANSAYAADYISADAKKIPLAKGYVLWVAGKDSIKVASFASKPAGYQAYDGNMVLGGYVMQGEIKGKKVEIEGALVKEDVIGGQNESGKITENTVVIKNATVEGDVYGGNSESSTVSNNKLIITNSTLSQEVVGGISDGGTVTNNQVSITGGTMKDMVYGGVASEKNANGNAVTISGAILKYSVYGGKSDGGNACDNKISISNSVVDDFTQVYGGDSHYSDRGKVDGNMVSITNTAISNVTGGYGVLSAQNNKVRVVTSQKDKTIGNITGGLSSSENGNSNNNLVLLRGGQSLGVTGGSGNTANNNLIVLSGCSIDSSLTGGSGKSAADGNTIVLVGKDGSYDLVSQDGKFKEKVVSSQGVIIKGTVWGGLVEGQAVAAKGNTLKVLGWNSQIKELFQNSIQKLEFVLPQGNNKGRDMLVLTGAGKTALTNFEGMEITAAPGALLNKGDSLNLIHKKTAGALCLWTGTSPETSIFDEKGNVKDASKVIVSSPLSATSGKVTLAALDGNEGGLKNDMVFTALDNISVKDNPEVEDNVKNTMEGRVNVAALLNDVGDFMVDQGMAKARAAAKLEAGQGNREFTPFAAVGGGKLRYKTGSHVDSQGWHGAVGVSKQLGEFLCGIALEHGKSNYDSYVNTTHGEGDAKATGGTLFAELQKNKGLHYDMAVRAGRVKNAYNANLNLFGVQQRLSYRDSSTYYGMSLGAGKEFSLKNKDLLDVYGRYYWAHTNSSHTTTNLGDGLAFDAVNSHRARLGGRYTHMVKEDSRLYAGIAWQYEFGGKAEAVVNSENAPAPTLKGHSGMLELGWQAELGKRLALDLNVSGWTGKQRGIISGLNLQWKF